MAKRKVRHNNLYVFMQASTVGSTAFLLSHSKSSTPFLFYFLLTLLFCIHTLATRSSIYLSLLFTFIFCSKTTTALLTFFVPTSIFESPVIPFSLLMLSPALFYFAFSTFINIQIIFIK